MTLPRRCSSFLPHKVGLSVSLVLASAWARAADPGAATVPANPEISTNANPRLPVVTVVAQKQPAGSQELPVSVTAITKSTIADADVRVVKDAAGYAPNVFLNEFTARKLSNPYFRGVGSSPNNPGVTTSIDGVPQLNANSSSIELIDVDQIEFVRGPQGALFGRNTVGGLINITSASPSLQDWRGDAAGIYGNYNLWDIRASASGPVVQDQLGLGVGLGFSSRDGYTKDDISGRSVDDREAFFGKGQALWVPFENWSVRLILSGERARDGDYALNDLAAVRANPFHVSRSFIGYTHRDLIAPTLLAHHDGQNVDFDMISGLVWWKTEDLTDLDYTPLPLITRSNEERDLQFTEELRLASPKDAPVELSDKLQFKWQSGITFFTQNYDQDAVNSYAPGIIPGVPFPVSQHTPQSTLDDIGVGGYAQGTLVAWEKLDFTAGVRGDYEDKKANLNTFFTTPGFPSSSISPHKDFAGASPQFSAAYHFQPDKTAYVTVGRGFKAGGFNASSPAGSEAYGEEKSWNYEVGVKSMWMEDRLSLNVDAFYIDWRSLQLNVPNPLVPGQFYIANAGGAASKGVELELNARPINGLDVFGGVGYTDARFLSGSFDSGVNVGGNKLPFTPDYTADAGVQFSHAVCKEATIYARAEVVLVGTFNYDSQNAAGQSAYSLAHFRAGVRGKHWFAEGWVRNAFDTEYVPIALAYPGLAPSGFLGEPGAPVTFGLRAGVKF